jgi:hypothetical protein
MLFGANAFRISGHKLKTEDSMQQCYMPCGRRNNNSPATGGENVEHIGFGYLFIFIGGRFRWDSAASRYKDTIKEPKALHSADPKCPAEPAAVVMNILVHKDGSATVLKVVEGDPILSSRYRRSSTVAL